MPFSMIEFFPSQALHLSIFLLPSLFCPNSLSTQIRLGLYYTPNRYRSWLHPVPFLSILSWCVGSASINGSRDGALVNGWNE